LPGTGSRRRTHCFPRSSMPAICCSTTLSSGSRFGKTAGFGVWFVACSSGRAGTSTIATLPSGSSSRSSPSGWRLAEAALPCSVVFLPARTVSSGRSDVARRIGPRRIGSMRCAGSLAICIALFWCSACSAESEADRLKDACESRECPEPAPEYLDCMPIVPPEWTFSCEDPCYSLFRDTCGIRYRL